MSPAAKPANPAPSETSSSRWCAGTSLAFGLPFSSTNWAKKNSTPRSFATRLTSSTLCGASARVTAICPPFESRLAPLRLSLLPDDLHDLAGVRVYADDGQLGEGALVRATPARDRQRHDPDGLPGETLAEQPHLGVLRREAHLLLGRRDRPLLGDPDLRLLAASGDEERQQQHAADHGNPRPRGAARPGGTTPRPAARVLQGGHAWLSPAPLRLGVGTRSRCS